METSKLVEQCLMPPILYSLTLACLWLLLVNGIRSLSPTCQILVMRSILTAASLKLFDQPHTKIQQQVSLTLLLDAPVVIPVQMLSLTNSGSGRSAKVQNSSGGCGNTACELHDSKYCTGIQNTRFGIYTRFGI